MRETAAVNLLGLVVGVVFIGSGLLGLLGRVITVPTRGGLRTVRGTEARVMGAVLLALGAFLGGAALGWF